MTSAVLAGTLAATGVIGGSLIAAPAAHAVPPFPIIDTVTATSGAIDASKWTLKKGSGGGGVYTSDKWMRLNAANQDENFSMTSVQSFNSRDGVQVEFDYRMAGGVSDNGATGDGMSVFLVGGDATASAGAKGEGLGYAGSQKWLDSGVCYSGVNKGYVGVGLDVWGGYGINTAGAYGGPYGNQGGGGQKPNTIGIRGSGGWGAGASCSDTANKRYPWVGGTGAQSPSLSTGAAGSGDPASNASSQYRRVRVTIMPSGTNTVTIAVSLSQLIGKNATTKPVFAAPTITKDITPGSAALPGQVALPDTLRLGFGASSGGSTDYKDIRNVAVRGVTDAALAGGITTTPANAAGYEPGEAIGMEYTATNNGPTAIGDFDKNGVARVYQDLTGQVNVTSWTCEASGGATCTVPSGTGSIINTDWYGPKGSSVKIKVTGTVAGAPGSRTTTALLPSDFTANTVGIAYDQIQADGGAIDTNAANNSLKMTYTVKADTTPPAVPVPDSPNNGKVVTGKAEPGATVNVYAPNGTTLLGTAQAGPDGKFSVTLNAAQADGQILQVEAVDASGNKQPTKAPTTVDAKAPEAPAVDATNGTKVTGTSTEPAGTVITIYGPDGSKAGTTTVQPGGTWSFTPATPFKDGDQIKVSATDSVGNESPKVSATVDASAAPPTVSAPADGAITNNNKPTVSGTAEKGATVTVIIDGQVVGTAKADATTGAWTFPLPSELADGTHTVSASQVDALGNKSDPSPAKSFTVDTAAPNAPTIDPSNGTKVTGTAPADAKTITLYAADGSVLKADIPVVDGKWTYTPATAFADGTELVAKAKDAAGNESGPASTVVDAVAPEAPVVNPTNGKVVTGTSKEPTGTKVTVYGPDGKALGTTTVEEGGVWSFTPATPLTNGTKIEVSVTDAAGNESPKVPATVDAAAVAPKVDFPAAGGTAGSTPTVTGSGAEPNAEVTVYIDGVKVGTTTADKDGKWSLETTAVLPDGNHTVSASQVDTLGNQSPQSTPNTFSVDVTAPAAPVITGPANDSVTNNPKPVITGTGEEGATVTVVDETGKEVGTAVVKNGTWSITPADDYADGKHTFTATQEDAAGNVSGPSTSVNVTVDTKADAPTVTGPAAGSFTKDTTPDVTGKAEPNAKVTVIIDGTEYGPVTADKDGNWTYTPSTPLGEGPHTVSAKQVDPAGNPSAPSTPSTFTVDTTVEAPKVTAPTAGSFTSDNTPDIKGTAEPGAEVTVMVDGKELGKVTADDKGNWSLTVTEPLGEGEHAITTTQVDKAGNTSGPSDPVKFTVDTEKPVLPSITGPKQGDASKDTTPDITGTAEPFADVTVIIDGTEFGPVKADKDGNWTYTPATPLAEGSHTVAAKQTDRAGNTSDKTPDVQFTIDTTIPAKPTITEPTGTKPLNDSTPDIKGKSEPGAAIKVTIDGEEFDAGFADGNGDWTFTPPKPLADGEHKVTATQTDKAGNTSPASDEKSFVTDTAAPAAPAISGPDTSTKPINNARPEISGTGEAGALITVTDADGNPIGDPVKVGVDGTWKLTPNVDLKQGDNQLKATQTDAAGNTSPTSPEFNVRVDTVADAAPVISGPVTGSKTNDSTPTISGTGVPGSKVVVTDESGKPVGDPVIVDEKGNWSLTPTTVYDDGEHTFKATQFDPAGNESPVSNEVVVTVDTTADGAPDITGPAEGDHVKTDKPEFSGTGEPGSTVNIKDKDGNVIATGKVGEDGTWTATPENPLPQGEQTFTATQTDPQGNESEPTGPLTFTVDTVAPDAPVISGPKDGSDLNTLRPEFSGTAEPNSTVNVKDANGKVIATGVADAEGNWKATPTEDLPEKSGQTFTATATDAAGNTSKDSEKITLNLDVTADAAPAITGPKDGSATNDTTPEITGTGVAGSTVNVIVDGVKIGEAEVDGEGKWTFTPKDALPVGDHVITATQTDPAGNESKASDPVNLKIDTTTPDAPVITGPADGADLKDNTPEITGKGEPGATVVVTDENGKPVGKPAVVDADGNWTVTPTEPLADGKHTFTATQTDPAGNESLPAEPIQVNVDTKAPEAPAISGPVSGADLKDNTPEITGTGEPGATVTIKDGDKVLGTAEVDEDGKWTFTPKEPLADGDHTFTATQTDPAGNVSQPSAPVEVNVDTEKPAAPSITEPANGADLKDNTPTFTGKGEPGATIVLTDEDGNPIGDPVVVDKDGNWTVTPTEPLTDGEHTIKATQTDPAGNVSEPSEPVKVNVDTVAPTAPAISGPKDNANLNTLTPEFSGTAEPNSTVNVKDADGNVIATGVADKDGNWTAKPTKDLPEGAGQTFTATSTDAAGNESKASDPITLNLDVTADEAPAITGPANGSIGNDNMVPITGTGAPGSVVTVKDGDKVVGEAKVQDDGTWVFTPTTPWTDGDHTFTATQKDPAGNVSDPSGEVKITVDTKDPAAPSISGPKDGDSIKDPLAPITGKGEPGATVTIKDGDKELGTAEVDQDGNWTFTPTTPLEDGKHELSATQTDPAGNTSAPSAPVEVTVDTQKPDAPVVNDTNGHVVTGTAEPGSTVTFKDKDGNVLGSTKADENGNFTWTPEKPLADKTELKVTATDEAGNESDPTDKVVDGSILPKPTVDPTQGEKVTGTGTPGATVIIRDESGKEIGKGVVGEDGKYEVKLTEPQKDGAKLSVTQQGKNGLESEPAEVTVDKKAPDAPTVDPTDGVKITGKGEPGSTITVKDKDGNVIGETTVDPDGTWSITPEKPLKAGDKVEVTATDPSGNVSKPTEATVSAPKLSVKLSVDPKQYVTTGDKLTWTAKVTNTGDLAVNNLKVDLVDDVTVVGKGSALVMLKTMLAAKQVSCTATALKPGASATCTFESTITKADLVKEGLTATAIATAQTVNVVQAKASASAVAKWTPKGIPAPKVDPTNGKKVTGTAQPGTTVVIRDADGNELGTAKVGKDGKWSFTPETPFADGTKLFVTARDANGTESPVTKETVDAKAPTAPVLDPSDGTKITGKAEPGSTVIIRDGNGKVIGKVIAGKDGRFSFTPATPLAPGAKFTAESVDAAGNVSAPAEGVVTGGGSGNGNGQGGGMANTGAEVGGLIGAGALLLLGGGWFLFGSRRRKEGAHRA